MSLSTCAELIPFLGVSIVNHRGVLGQLLVYVLAVVNRKICLYSRSTLGGKVVQMRRPSRIERPELILNPQCSPIPLVQCDIESRFG